MASAEREPITGVWGRSPQRGPGAEPLVGSRGRSHHEAESLLPFRGRKEAAKCFIWCILETHKNTRRPINDVLIRID